MRCTNDNRNSKNANDNKAQKINKNNITNKAFQNITKIKPKMGTTMTTTKQAFMFAIKQQQGSTTTKKNLVGTTPPMEHNNKIKQINLRRPRHLSTNKQNFTHTLTTNKPHTNKQTHNHHTN